MKRSRIFCLTMLVGVLTSMLFSAIPFISKSASADTNYDQPVPAGTTVAYTSPSVIHLSVSNLQATNNQNQSVTFNINADFTDPGIWDDDHQYSYKSGVCTSTIDLPSNFTFGQTSDAHIELCITDPYQDNQPDVYDFTYNDISNTNNVGNTIFDWTSTTSVTNVAGAGELLGQVSPGVFKGKENQQDYVSSGTNSTCFETLTFDGGSVNNAGLHVTCQSNTILAGGKAEDYQGVYVAGSPTAPVTSSNGGGTGSGSGNPAGQTSPNINCSVHIFNPLSWILCPLAAGLEGLATGLDNAINSELTVSTSEWDSTYYSAWSTIRDLALGLIVIAGLVAIISQAAGFEFFDAYTIRKALPRILIVAIGISISWPVLKEFVYFTNDLGNGVRSLIYLGARNANGGTSSVDLGGGGQAVIGLIAAVALSPLGVGFVGLLTFAGTAALAASVAFLVLVLRQMVILVLVIFSPIAMACYVLPHTQRYWKLWWESFSKGLLMFPLIAAIIAAGRVFAADSSQHAGAISEILAFVSYFAPYFLIPFTFRLAGGAIANIGGFVNDRHRGGFDALKNVRANQTKKRRANLAQNATTGNLFKKAQEGTLRDKINRGVEGATKIGAAGYDPRNMRSRMRTAMSDSAESHVAKFAESDDAKAIFGDDPLVWAAKETSREGISRVLQEQDAERFGHSANAETDSLNTVQREDAINRILRAQAAGGNETFQRARVRAQSKTGTGYQRNVDTLDENGDVIMDQTVDADGNQVVDANGVPQTHRRQHTIFDAAMMAKDINDAYGADRNGANRALAEMRNNLAQSGQVAGLAGFGTWSKQLENLSRNGASEENMATVNEAIMDDTMRSVGPGQAIYGKPTSAAAIGQAHARRIQRIGTQSGIIREGIKKGTHTQAQLDASEAELSGAVASAAGLYDAMGQASPQNAEAFAQELMSARITGGPEIPGLSQPSGPTLLQPNGQPFPAKSAPTPTVRQYIEWQMGGNAAFADRRRDLSQAAYASAQQSQAAQAARGQGGIPQGPGGGLPGGL